MIFVITMLILMLRNKINYLKRKTRIIISGTVMAMELITIIIYDYLSLPYSGIFLSLLLVLTASLFIAFYIKYVDKNGDFR